MSKKLLTVKEWAEKYCEWYNDKEVNLSPSDIIYQINNEKDNNIENKIPSVQDLNDLYLKVEEGNFVYGGNIFDVMSDDDRLPNENDAVGSNFIPISFLYCNIDVPYDFECPEDGDEEPICDGSMSGIPGDEAWCNGTGTGVDGDDGPICDGSASGADGDEEPDCDTNNACDEDESY